MKIMKILGILVLLLVIIIGGALFYLFSNINGIVKRGIESKGTEMTSTDVDVGGVDIELLNGRAELSNFTIANPSDFGSPKLFEAKQLVFNIDPASIRSDVIVIDEILVDGVTVVAEQKGLTTNIQAILATIKENLPKSKDDAVKKDGEPLRFMVKKLRFADSSLRLITEKHGEQEFVIPAIEAAGLGSKEAGLTAQELGVAILEPYLEKAKAVARDKARAVAEDKLKDKAEAKLKDKLGDDVEKASDKIKNLF